jgi:tetratricopeptide (TPR) repeat protein
MLDRNGNRIDRRNPQDIFTPLYNHQIPPGAAQVVHYKLDVPKDVKGPVRLKAQLRYRKFDYPYMRYVYPNGVVPKLPIVDICEDEITLPVAGVAENVPEQASPIRPAWQRWNDYGIGCFLEGGLGSKKGELRQARDAFQELIRLGVKDAQGHAYLNLARVAFDEGRLDDAVAALNQARATDPPAPWWTVAWFIGLVNAQNGHLDEAIANFEQILDPKNQPVARKFDFTKDYVVINELGNTLFKRAQLEQDDLAARDRFLRQAVERYQSTLWIDPEDLDAHYGLAQCFGLLGAAMPAAENQEASRVSGRDGLLALGKKFADVNEPNQRRIQAAAELSRAINQFGDQAPNPTAPKLQILQALMSQCRPVYESATDEQLRAAAAHVLGTLHRQAHRVFKPDESAQDRAVRVYRQSHPAANHAAEAIVIYLLNKSTP